MSPSENGSLLFWTSQHKEGCLQWEDIAPISLFVLQPLETEVHMLCAAAFRDRVPYGPYGQQLPLIFNCE